MVAEETLGPQSRVWRILRATPFRSEKNTIAHTGSYHRVAIVVVRAYSRKRVVVIVALFGGRSHTRLKAQGCAEKPLLAALRYCTVRYFGCSIASAHF